MSYIIIWRHRHRDPHVGTDMSASGDYLREYSSYEDAKESAESILEHEGPNSPWYYDYAIYEEVES